MESPEETTDGVIFPEDLKSDDVPTGSIMEDPLKKDGLPADTIREIKPPKTQVI